MKTTRLEIEQVINPLIGGIDPVGLSKDTKLNLIYLKLQLAEELKEINSFREDISKNTPDYTEYNELLSLGRTRKLTEEEEKRINEIGASIHSVFGERANKLFGEELELRFTPLTEEEFGTVVENNKIASIYGYEQVYKLLVGEQEPPLIVLDSKE